jgi:hypothetical protein
LLDLFADDAVVYEPFRNVRDGLKGKSAIAYFQRVAVMANAGMRKTIEFINTSEDSMTRLVTFEDGSIIKGKFSFDFVLLNIGRKITMLTLRLVSFSLINCNSIAYKSNDDTTQCS